MVSWPLTNPWASTPKPSATDMKTNITDPLNDLYARSIALAQAGTLIAGSYNTSAPYLFATKRLSGTSDGAGLIAISFSCSALLWVGLTPEMGSIGSATALHLRNNTGETSTSQIALQMRGFTAQASTVYLANILIIYQA